MKQYGDVVTYVRNGDELEALVVQSNVSGEGRLARELLVLVYLDPAAKAILIRDMKKVVATAFNVSPFTDGASQGWKDTKAELVGDVAEYKHQLAKKNDIITELQKNSSDTVIHPDGTFDGPAPLTKGVDLG